MNKTFAVMQHEMRTTLRRKSFTIMAFGIPLLLGLIALALILIRGDHTAQGGAQEGVGVAADQLPVEGYVDAAGLVTTMPADIPPGILLPFEDETAARTALEKQAIEGYFLIAPDYVESGELTYVTSDRRPSGDQTNRYALEWVLLVNLLGSEEQAAVVRQPLNLEVTPVGGDDVAAEESWVVEMFPTLIVLLIYIAVIMPASTLINVVADEKKNRVMEVLVVSVSSHQYISGKILALGLLGLLQTGVWMAVFWGVARFGGRALGIPPGFTIPAPLIAWTLVYGFLGYAMYGVLLAGLGALVPEVKDARTASLLIMLPLIVAYTFNVIMLERPNSTAALVISLFPLTGPVSMIGRMSVSDVPLWQVVLAAALQLLTAVLLLRLVARMFRAQQLLSGQPFATRRYFGMMLGRDQE